ncbi:MAG TPA: beta-N-acetylhexosaminidase, partial [Candidatus Hydrogenedentes bacterium]|nr:beta-N-acetylhexosaminidase [Candidatus Hydrogenedentota bacterium]
MTLALIPQPKTVRTEKGEFRPPKEGSIAIPSASWLPAAEALRTLFPKYVLHATAPGLPNTITLFLNRKVKPQGYTLDIGGEGIFIEASDADGARNAVRTLGQIARQTAGTALPALRINDWPDFPARGAFLDLSRGRVPKVERIAEWAATLADYKINQAHLYIEHTFRYRAHPLIGKGASPLDAADVLRLDAHASARGVELIPAMPCCGHMEKILKHAPYRDLAEDWGVGRYAAPDAEDVLGDFRTRGWTISPANPDTYPFLHSLFAEVLPLFRSERVNICCDEAYDLGLGQSYLMAEMTGRGTVYLDHVAKLGEMVKHFGKRAMFWGDMIRRYPELIERVPEDLTVLDWGYAANHDFGAIRDFTAKGLECYACPGTSSWVSL